MILDEANRKNLIFLILQFLHEEGYKESLHLLEQDSGIFFNFAYFSNAIINGNWKDAEDYLSAFTSPDVNTYSRKMFFDMYKRKFSEAPDRSTFSKDLRRIPVFKDDGFDDLVEVMTADDISIADQICCVDKASLRTHLCIDLHQLADFNPDLCAKLNLPKMNQSALLSLIFLISPNSNRNKAYLKEDLICLILQFLNEAKYKNTWHKLEQETKLYFNLTYLEEVMTLGQLEKTEEYVAAFTGPPENKYSKAMFLEIQKLKCLESTQWEVTTPSGSRDNILLKFKLHASVALLAKKNPVLKDKLSFPNMEKSRLLTVIKQTMNWWIPHTCRNSNSLENVPVVPHLCGAPFSIKKKFHDSGRRTKVNFRKPTEINDPSECNALVLPDYWLGERIACLTYSPSGDYILALAEDDTHKLWTWSSAQKEFCKENAFPDPRLHQTHSRKTMKNEVSTSIQNSWCFAIKGSYLFSTSGGKIAVFDLKSLEKVAAFGNPAVVTYFVFITDDLLAVGLDDGSICIHCLSYRKIKEKLKGHDKRITCLAFSRCFDVLVSSGADGKICVWSTKSWLELTSNNSSRRFCTRQNHESSSLVTHIQFDPYQIELLVVQEGWIGVHEAPTFNCLLQWVPNQSDAVITCATYSSDGELIYVCFRSGSIKIVDSKTFTTICRINLTAFTQPIPGNIRLEVYPAVVAAHPSHPYQISAGLSDGKVVVLQPLRREGWVEEANREDNKDYFDESNNC